MTDVLEDELRATLRAVAETCSPPAGGPPDVPELRPGRARLWLAVAAAAVLAVAIAVPLLATSDERQPQGPVEVGPTSVSPSTSVAPTTTSLPPDTSSAPPEAPIPSAEGWAWSVGAEAPIRPSLQQFAVWTGGEMLVWSMADGDLVGAAYDPAANAWRDLGRADLGSGVVPRGVVWVDDRAVFYVEEAVTGDSIPGYATQRAFDPTTGEWETLLPLYDLPAGRFATMHVIDGELVIEMIRSDGSPGVLDDVGQVVPLERDFPTDGSDAAFATLEPTYELVTVAPVDIGDALVVGRTDPATGETTWLLVSADATSALPDAPDPSWWTGATAVWTGERVIVWGGWACPPAASCAVDNGPTRPLVLSRPVLVPTVIDLIAATAEASLHNQGLHVVIEYREATSGESVGRVVDQDPAAFTAVQPGTIVTITVAE